LNAISLFFWFRSKVEGKNIAFFQCRANGSLEKGIRATQQKYFFLHPKKERKNYPQWQRQQLKVSYKGLIKGSLYLFRVCACTFSAWITS